MGAGSSDGREANPASPEFCVKQRSRGVTTGILEAGHCLGGGTVAFLRPCGVVGIASVGREIVVARAGFRSECRVCGRFASPTCIEKSRTLDGAQTAAAVPPRLHDFA